jgi:hypothetical protein
MSGCNYTLTENTNGFGGELQSDVTTKLLCQSRCDGDGLPNDLQCYAYDWETGSSHCFIFTSQDYTMNEEGNTPGVNHNKKDTTCIGKTVMSEKCHIFTSQYRHVGTTMGTRVTVWRAIRVISARHVGTTRGTHVTIWQAMCYAGYFRNFVLWNIYKNWVKVSSRNYKERKYLELILMVCKAIKRAMTQQKYGEKLWN